MNAISRTEVSRRVFLGGTAALAAGRRWAALADDNTNQKPLKVCLVSGSLEYKSDESLTAYEDYLKAEHDMTCSRAFRQTDDELPGLENLETCDVALFFTRRLEIAGEALDRVKNYCDAGKPIVGVRTASHGFQNWLEIDKEVFGGDYKGHYPEGPRTAITVGDGASDHPILQGFTPFESIGSLYRNRNIAADADVLLRGLIPGHVEPIAWTRMRRGGRVFYTSLGHPNDFQIGSFRRLLANALLWTTGRLG